MSKIFQIALGILAAIGGFVDIGDLVFNVEAGATLGYQLLWVVVVGVVGIIVYSEMCGRVAAVSKRPVFDAIRERLGFGVGFGALVASQIVNLMTLAAEVGGVALALELLSGLPYRVLIVLGVVGACGRHLGRCRSSGSSGSSATAGSRLLVFVVAAIKLHPDWGDVATGFVPHGTSSDKLVYAYFAVGLARSGHDSLRGVLLLVGRRRGGLDAEGPRARTGRTRSSVTASAGRCRLR